MEHMATTFAGVLNRNSKARELKALSPEERQTWLAENELAVALSGACNICGGPLGEEAVFQHLCCPCLDSGFRRRLAPEGVHPHDVANFGKVEPCECRLTDIPEQEFWRRSGVPATMRGYTLDSWNDGSDFAQKAVRFAGEYLQDWPPRKPLLLLTGSVGAGKSGYAVGITRGLWQRHHKVGRYIKAKGLIDRFFASFSQNRLTPDERTGETTEDIHNELDRAPLIVLDDLGTETDSRVAYAEILNLIDGRTANGRPLIVTTNLEPMSLDERIRSRLKDTERGLWLQFTGADRRDR